MENKYFEIYVNDKVCSAYSIYAKGTGEEFKNIEDVIRWAKREHIFTEIGDEDYIEYIHEISEDTYNSATFLSNALNALNGN